MYLQWHNNFCQSFDTQKSINHDINFYIVIFIIHYQIKRYQFNITCINKLTN